MEDGYPKFQLSKFLKGAKDYQIVVRAETADQLISQMKDIAHFIKSLEEKSTPAPQTNDLKAFCKRHSVEMKHYTGERNGEPTEWWSHKTDDGGFCNGKRVNYPKER